MYCFFFYLGFVSQTFTNHMTAREWGRHSINSSVPLPPVSQILRYWLGDYSREVVSAHSPAAGLELGTFGFRAQVTNH